MPEIVIVRQKSNFEIDFRTADTDSPSHEHHELRPVQAIHDLTPYGMLLAGLGACTTILLHSYAQNHGVDLDEVELRVSYDRQFDEDCEHCEEIGEYTEKISAEVAFQGDLDERMRNKLFLISKHCPVHKILHDGIETVFTRAED
jgi:putative redox protein